MMLFLEVAFLGLAGGALVATSGLLWGPVGWIPAAALLWAASTWLFFRSGAWVLGHHRAVPLEPHQDADLFPALERAAAACHIPTPKLYLIPEQAPNALATGTDLVGGAIGLTEGLLATFTPEEREAVLARECARIGNGDALAASVTATLLGWLLSKPVEFDAGAPALHRLAKGIA